MNDSWKIICSVFIIGIAAAIALSAGNGSDANGDLKAFASYEELQEFVTKGRSNASSYGYDSLGGMGRMATVATASVMEASTAKATDYSTTNIQVEGVDEADIVKSDGEYIYALSNNKVSIVKAYPSEEAAKATEIKAEGSAREIFVNNDRLIIFSEDYGYTRGGTGDAVGFRMMPSFADYSKGKTIIAIYDISERNNPELARKIETEGTYFSSRMVGDYVYAITTMQVYGEPVPLPVITENGEEKEVKAEEIYYSPNLPPSYGHNYVNIIAVNVNDDAEEYNSRTFLSVDAQNTYVSENNIYITYTAWETREFPIKPGVVQTAVAAITEAPEEKTAIHKIAINKGAIDYKGSGAVPGRVLNQFSMDEHEGKFRIATTEGRVSRSLGEATSRNNIYVLDEELDVIGKLEDLAPGESIYSARFMGERAYLVTFKKVDPLFVIDLSEPAQPKVLGKLKIPGYSDYLHPYDENHIIGVGKEAADAEEGDFAWYQGLKLALFDVSDPSTPREVAKVEIGDRGTDSYALRDHKAFLFSREKNLLAIPVLLAKIDESRYAGEIPPYAYGDYVWQGAYVFSLDTENGFELKGRVSHTSEDEMLKSGYYFESDASVKRTLYIEDSLYTVSDRMIKINELSGLQEIKAVSLQ